MAKTGTGCKFFIAILVLTSALFYAPRLFAKDPVESAAVGLGVSAGNMWFVPIKAISVLMGASAGALSFVVTGGDAELTRQIWQDSTQGPYLITPVEARRAIGERPELTRE